MRVVVINSIGAMLSGMENGIYERTVLRRRFDITTACVGVDNNGAREFCRIIRSNNNRSRADTDAPVQSSNRDSVVIMATGVYVCMCCAMVLPL